MLGYKQMPRTYSLPSKFLGNNMNILSLFQMDIASIALAMHCKFQCLNMRIKE